MLITSTISMGNVLQVTFDDGSVWACSRSGEEWRKQQLSTKELQEKFDALTNESDVTIASELKKEITLPSATEQALETP